VKTNQSTYTFGRGVHDCISRCRIRKELVAEGRKGRLGQPTCEDPQPGGRINDDVTSPSPTITFLNSWFKNSSFRAASATELLHLVLVKHVVVYYTWSDFETDLRL